MIETLPGVVEDPPTVSQGTDEAAVNVSAWAPEDDATGMVAGAGAELVPAVIANDALACASTRFVIAGWTLPVTVRLAVAGVAAESVTITVNVKLPGVAGVPPIVEPLSERPAGNDPEVLKV